MIYFFFPETARLTLEEIAKNFGEEVAVHVTDATDAEKAQLGDNLGRGISDTTSHSQARLQSHFQFQSSDGSETCTEGLGADGEQEREHEQPGVSKPRGQGVGQRD